MKKSIKKSLLGLGMLAVVAIPTATLTSCSMFGGNQSGVLDLGTVITQEKKLIFVPNNVPYYYNSIGNYHFIYNDSEESMYSATEIKNQLDGIESNQNKFNYLVGNKKTFISSASDSAFSSSPGMGNIVDKLPKYYLSSENIITSTLSNNAVKTEIVVEEYKYSSGSSSSDIVSGWNEGDIGWRAQITVSLNNGYTWFDDSNRSYIFTIYQLYQKATDENSY